MNVKKVQNQIKKIEGFRVKFRYRDASDVHDDRQGLPGYPYGKGAWNKWTVTQWIEHRFKKKFPGFEVTVEFEDGSSAHGATKLVTVRDTY